MNPRLTIALAVLLAVLAGVYFFGGLPEAGPPGPGVTGTPTPVPPEIIAYNTGDIARLAVRSGTTTVTVQKDAQGNWTYADGRPADNTRINAITMRLGNLKARGKVADSVPSPTEYGLAPPDSELIVSKGAESLTLVIGAQNPQRTGYYTQISGVPTLYLVESLLVDDLKRLVTQPPDPPTPTPVPTITSTPAGTATSGPTGTPTP